MTDSLQQNSKQHQETVESIQAWLIEQISGLLAIDAATIDIRAPFSSFGLSSRDAILLSGDLEEWLDRRLSPTLIYEYPTIEALASFLSAVPSQTKPSGPVSPTPVTPAGPSNLMSPEELSQLSEEEAEQLLLEKLNQIKRGQ